MVEDEKTGILFIDPSMVEMIPINDLKVYKKNAKKHTPEQLEQIKNSIEAFGMNDPIAVWGDDNVIVEGHGRYLALRSIGETGVVPCIRLDHLTDEQRKAYALAHNQLTMNTGFDDELLLPELAELADFFDMSDFGFDLGDEGAKEPEKEAVEDDFDPNELPPARTNRGDIYILGNHRLMCGDSTDLNDVETLMGDTKADILLTDPPYNVNYEGGTKDKLKIMNDSMGDAAFLAFLTDAFINADTVMRAGAAFYIWHSDSESLYFREAVQNAGWKLRQNLIWVKNALVLGRQDYQWKHEPCLYGWKNGTHYFTDDRTQATVVDDKIDLKKLKKEEMLALLEEIFSEKTPTTVLYENKPTVNDIHPTMKPIKLLARLIKNSSKPGELVLDLFGGSGSTMIACEQLDRTCYMMELDPHYCDVIIKRWEDFTGKTAELLEGENG